MAWARALSTMVKSGSRTQGRGIRNSSFRNWFTTAVRFEARRCLRRPVAAVTAVELQDPPEGPQPSLILRRMAEGETLWDIARQYRTDEEAIRAANELTEDRPEGMLLIPRVR